MSAQTAERLQKEVSKRKKDMEEMQKKWEIYRQIRIGQPEYPSIRPYRWLRGSIEDHIDARRRERVERDRMSMLAGGDRPRSTSRDSDRSFRSHSPGMAGAEKR